MTAPSQTVVDLVAELDRDRATLERELTEIELLMRQAESEAARHEARRAQAEERLNMLELDARSEPAAVAEARTQLISQTRRQTMMQGQVEVLEGKRRALERFRERLDHVVTALGSVTPGPGARDGDAAPGDVPRAGASREVMAAQEQMRRDIARQMHDGPAQSIANIALQAQIVERLFARDPRQAATELGQLVAMVQHALEQTKNFIFDVRPMVLDDLGLVPTLRRAAAERTRRSGQRVLFESVGADVRLPTDIESALFRIVDDAVQAFVDARPSELVVRLDWLESGLKATVRGRPHGEPAAGAEKAKAAVEAARRDKRLPQALASMIHEQEATAARGLPDAAWNEIRERAEPVGIEMFRAADGWLVEARVSYRR